MLNQFKEELQREGKSHLTIEAYLTDIEQFQSWLQGTLGYETDAITETDVREYRQYLNLQKKLKATTINRKLKSIFCISGFCLNRAFAKKRSG
ncbi:phage integrase N-terminal SAM-like domain-containing protein [Paenibacillus sp. FSL E2-0190]|uniref:phage integrase N-terminal SAM-like domain-containing protein n=1 Tax=Paenibacillus sp. FSL E2-0190 TaxID=2954504 RepID=UPI0030EBE6A2